VIGSHYYFEFSKETLRFPVIKSPAFILSKNGYNVFQWLLYIKYGGLGWVGTLSDFATLLRHNNTKRLPTAGVICMNNPKYIIKAGEVIQRQQVFVF